MLQDQIPQRILPCLPSRLHHIGPGGFNDYGRTRDHLIVPQKPAVIDLSVMPGFAVQLAFTNRHAGTKILGWGCRMRHLANSLNTEHFILQLAIGRGKAKARHMRGLKVRNHFLLPAVGDAQRLMRSLVAQMRSDFEPRVSYALTKQFRPCGLLQYCQPRRHLIGVR